MSWAKPHDVKKHVRCALVFVRNTLALSFLTDRLLVEHCIRKDLRSRSHLPWLGQNVRIFYRGFPAKRIPRAGVTLHHMQRFGMKVPASSLAAGDAGQPRLVIKVVTSTTSVSPSQWPTESPKYEGSTSVRCGRPSVGTRRKLPGGPSCAS